MGAGRLQCLEVKIFLQMLGNCVFFLFLCFQKPVRIRTEEGPSLLIFPQKPRSESEDMEVEQRHDGC